ncbi:MAG: thioredoxin [Tepidimonas taiwanensis]|uniref:thioredoxin n=1 Tax=Tepidimonas taiwanensis TaxID=307486 RepID=UPI0005BCEDF7|nr:thioredoxin [Tepidimonas taiwanensis]MCX7693897.1 thioredoxin [Tepidimonas taiwanensis]
MIDVTLANFQAEVLEASLTTPVLVDFWAPWCGPCKVLGPLLEKVEQAYGGRFILAKVNTEEEQQLAGYFQIRSIPTCILFVGGQPVDGFMGALPEGQIRAFLDRHLPSEADLLAAAERAEAEAAAAHGDADAALQRLRDALAKAPDNDDVRFDLVRLLIESGQLAEAAAALAPALGKIPVPLRFEALAQWLNALEFVANDPRGQWPLEKFDELIAANRRDFETRLAKARVLIARGEWTAAMDELLEIIMRDKKWGDEVPRKTVVALLELMTPPKRDAAAAPKSAVGLEIAGHSATAEDPQAELVSRYRRKLSMALN